jgi:hypothetical protein
MTNYYEELYSILKIENDIHENLLDIAIKLNKSIKDDDLLLIQQYTIQHDEVICNLEKIEERRQSVCQLIQSSLNLNTKALKLNSIIDKTPSDLKTDLRNIHSSLKNKIEHLASITTSNNILLESALKIVNKTFSFIQQSQNRFQPYVLKKNKKIAFQSYGIINRTI